ncbi:MAG: Asp-tRNA(Asn)/Glu-tRNA(Gln) amidotransferase subunit GatC [Alphaproteobacteria bacterium]|nr:Asp-tRNA(Asn)/Glu-tRNA(Gln) amidotransferase subunit GatC [Alphaproteobacteria bacterium]
MSMDKETVRKVASLANIEMDEAELERAAAQISGIIDWVEQLGAVNTDNIEPLANVANIELSLRADSITDGNYQDKILANAPEHTQGFFVVPKIVEQQS